MTSQAMGSAAASIHQADHQGHAAPRHGTAIHDNTSGRIAAKLASSGSTRAEIQVKRDALILDPAAHLLRATIRMNLAGYFAGESSAVGNFAQHDPADHPGQGVQMARQVALRAFGIHLA